MRATHFDFFWFCSVQESILNCIHTHCIESKYWTSLRVHKNYNLEDLNNLNPQPELHKVIKKFIGDSEPRPERFPTRDCYPTHDEKRLKELADRLLHLRMTTNLSFAPERVCYVYDVRMTEHENNYEP